MRAARRAASSWSRFISKEAVAYIMNILICCVQVRTAPRHGNRPTPTSGSHNPHTVCFKREISSYAGATSGPSSVRYCILIRQDARSSTENSRDLDVLTLAFCATYHNTQAKLHTKSRKRTEKKTKSEHELAYSFGLLISLKDSRGGLKYLKFIGSQ